MELAGSKGSRWRLGAISRNLTELEDHQGSYLSIHDQPVVPLKIIQALFNDCEKNVLLIYGFWVLAQMLTKSLSLPIMENDKVIAPRMFRINPTKTSREDEFMPINQARASVRTNPITVSQPHVITKKDVNSDLNGLSSIGVDITAKTRRPQPRSNTKNDRIPSAFKSSCIKNKEVKVEDHHRNLLLSKNKKHMSSECNNIKLAIWNDKSKVVCDICKQCLLTANHDVCVLNYVNAMNSHANNQNAKVSNTANQKKHKANVKNSKKLGSKEKLASPKPSKPRLFLRWSPTGRIFDCSGKLIESSDFRFQSDSSKGDNACTSNPQEPTRKQFPNSTSFLGSRKHKGKWYILLIVDDCSRYTSVHFLRSKNETPEVIKTFLEKIQVLLQAPVIIIRTDNGTEFKNQVLTEYFDDVGITHQTSSVKIPMQNGVVEQRNRTLVEAARTMLIFSYAPLFFWAEAIATTLVQKVIYAFSLVTLLIPVLTESTTEGKEDHRDGEFQDSISLMLRQQTSQKPTEHELDLWFEAMYDDYIGGQMSDAPRTTPAALVPQVLQTPTTSTTTTDNAPTPTNSSSQAAYIPITLQDADELQLQQHDQQQDDQVELQPEQLLKMFQMLCSMGIHLSTLLLHHPQVLLNHHLNMWIHRICIHFINRSNMSINGLNTTL
ncbi:retrovirus-related pol polyprotein from transposon TNT 1-94 [Tanacetum coccineum]